MPLEIVIVPCLSDNYAYLLHDAETGATAVVDVPDPAPIQQELDRRGWRLGDILITHHHWDHIDGVDPLREATGARVVGAKADAHRLPDLDLALSEGDTVLVGGEKAAIIEVSGHTIGHIAYHFADSQAVFTADSLMVLGCGRLFEGTPDMMWDSLSKLAALPPETRVYSGHDYAASNAKFALTIEPDNADLISVNARLVLNRLPDVPTVPSTIGAELATNPFLRAARPEVKALIGLPDATDAAAFAEIRKRKDNF